MALNKAPDPPLLGSPITDRGGLLIQSGQQLLDRIWRQVAAGHVVIPCEAVTASNVITLTPKLHPNGAEDLGDHMTFAFTADATSTGSVTAIVGAIPEIKVYVNGGADQAGTGDVVLDKTYFGTYVAALDSGNGGLVLVGEQNASGIVGLVIGTNVQAYDSDLAALASNSTNGLWARTGNGTGSARTIVGTTNEIEVYNGDGGSGNPTVGLPDSVTITTDLTVGSRGDFGSHVRINTAYDAPGYTDNNVGITLRSDYLLCVSRASAECASFNRKTNDGIIVRLIQDGTTEGTISVSGTTVSYNGGHLARWAQWGTGYLPPRFVPKGTVLANLDEKAEWIAERWIERDYTETVEAKIVSGSERVGIYKGDVQPGDTYVDDAGRLRTVFREDNEQLNRVIVSNVDADPNFGGLFVSFDEDGDLTIAGRGDFVCRIHWAAIVRRGDLLVSAGDGTARPLDPDTPMTARLYAAVIGKVMSGTRTETYSDGSYTVPVML